MSNNSSSNSRKRFLLIRTDRIGDTILTLPAVTALRMRYGFIHRLFGTALYRSVN